MNPEDRVWRWIDGAIIGLGLCPFAVAPRRNGDILVHISPATDARAAIDDTVDVAEALLDLPGKTTLVVLPHTLQSFSDYLDALATLEEELDEAGYPGWIQVASFHPDYRFADALGSDPANHTNRSPYPIFHLLREDELYEAIERHKDPEGIPERNVERLRAMGKDALRDLWETW